MKIKPYDLNRDFERVGQFLIDTYRPGEMGTNWLQSRWEYMHYHTFILDLDVSKIGIAEDGGEIFRCS